MFRGLLKIALLKGTASELLKNPVLLKGTASAVPYKLYLNCGFSR